MRATSTGFCRGGWNNTVQIIQMFKRFKVFKCVLRGMGENPSPLDEAFKVDQPLLPALSRLSRVHRSRVVVWSFFFICLLSMPAAGADNANPADTPKVASPLLRKTIFGLGLHDTGPISDKQENGVDPNWELQFNPPQWKWWRWVGSPYTVVGVMANFTGATSQLYTALNYEVSLSNKYTDALTFNLTKTLFVSVALGPAIHNGPLKKNEEHCKKTDDCGFGYRVVPRLFGEIGTYFLKNHGISFFVDHMSGANILGASQNEGVDHVGIRYHYVFKTD